MLTQAGTSEMSRLLGGTTTWELLVALGSVLASGFLTWVIARVLARRLSGTTRFGLRKLHRLVAPLTTLVSLLVAFLIIRTRPRELAILDEVLQLVATLAGFWLAARVIDVAWATALASARVRTRHHVGSLLLAARHVGKLVLALTALGVLAVQLGAGDQLYVILAAAAAGLAFAARDPIRNAVAFASIAVDPPFHVGDRVRISDYRSGESSVGTVTDISLTSVTLLTRAQTHVVIANVMLGQLRIENLSAADRRRLELEIPAVGLRTETVRDACDAIDRDLREHPGVSTDHAPRVWLAGASDGLHLKVSLWLRRAADRRDVQRDVLLKIHDRLTA